MTTKGSHVTSKEIRMDEWLAELQRVSWRSDEGMTSFEISQKLGVSITRVKEMLRAAYRMGRLVVGKSSRPSIDGRHLHVPVYRINKKGGGRK